MADEVGCASLPEIIINVDTVPRGDGDRYNDVLLNNTYESWRKVDAIFIDADTALFTKNVMLTLAHNTNCLRQVEEIKFEVDTRRKDAMKGFLEQMAVIKPTLNHLMSVMENNPPQLQFGATEFIWYMQRRNIPIYILSLSLKCMITTVVRPLGIPYDNVYANDALFRFSGEYGEHYSYSPFCQYGPHAKKQIISDLKLGKNYKMVALIGSGPTDWDAAYLADLFIIFHNDHGADPTPRTDCHYYATNYKFLMHVHKTMTLRAIQEATVREQANREQADKEQTDREQAESGHS